ncbi:MAG TPA: hypothetical protein VJW73_10180 [Gemmatimonadaceae bacterium]|nr:hypothetical protein [Gemmatimonadaceae bacterium]
MTTSDARPTSASSAATPPIEAWLTPIGIAALASGIVSCLGTPMMWMTYYRYRWGTAPHTTSGRMTLTSEFAVRPFLFCIGWSLLFALCYREWPALRRVTDKIFGMIAVTALFGTALWALSHFVIFPHKLGEAAYEVPGWLRFVLFVAPPIVWATRRFSPLAPRRPFWSRHEASPEGGQRQITTGLVLAIAAGLYLALFITHPGTDYSLLLGLLLALGAVLVLGIGTSLILGGIWTRRGWPGRALVRLSPLLLALSGAWYVYVR